MCAAGWKDDVDDAIHASHGDTVSHELLYKSIRRVPPAARPPTRSPSSGSGANAERPAE